MILRSALIFIIVAFIHGLPTDNRLKVLITGAAGKTGSLVVQKLIGSTTFSPVALVRTKKSASKLFKLGLREDQVVVADIKEKKSLQSAFDGIHACVLCTSATPKINFFSLIKVFILKLFGKAARPTFTFPNGDPYDVDWLGARNQIDAAKSAGVKQFVFLSSMGGTQPENFLNTIGRRKNDEKSGNILMWKRKAEQYLMSAGLPYTIIHPGGLTDKKGGESKVIMNFDDQLLERKIRSIPREDVAEVCVQALAQPGAKRRAFDIIAEPVATPEEVTSDWKAFFDTRGNCKY
jgi:uncharacterized protein YbjT (DUF2867 family)